LCNKQGIALSAYGPQTPVTKCPGGPVDAVLAKLTKKYAVNAGEILLRWCIEQDVVAVTTSSKEQRLSDYLRAMTFKLTPAEVKMVSSLVVVVVVVVVQLWRSSLQIADILVLSECRSTRLVQRSISVRSGRTSSLRTIGGREERCGLQHLPGFQHDPKASGRDRCSYLLSRRLAEYCLHA
jgi:hypothetical protein